jgi:ADP-glucose pyrophosphorylase
MRGCKNVVIDRGVSIPEGLVVGDDPESRRQMVPPDR